MYLQVFSQDDLRPLATVTHILSGEVQSLHNQIGQATLVVPLSSPEIRNIVSDSGLFDLEKLVRSSMNFFGVVRDGRGRVRISGRMSVSPADDQSGGNLQITIVDLLDELRLFPLPPNSNYNGYVLTLIEQTLAMMPACIKRESSTPQHIVPDKWRLGDVTAILDGWTSQDVSNMSLLEAIISICDATGNLFRLRDPESRVLDVYSDAPSNTTKLYFVQGAFFERTLTGRIVQLVQEPVATIESDSIIAGVIPEGGSYRKPDNIDRTLRLEGTEIVPSGYKLFNYRGYWGVFNKSLIGSTPTAVLPKGKFSVEAFGSITPSVNTDESISFVVTRVSSDTTQSMLSGTALDGFEPDHWKSAEVSYGESQKAQGPGGVETPVVFKVVSSAGDQIIVKPHVDDQIVTGYRLSPSIGDTVSLSVFREWDENKVKDTRQSLAAAAVAYLKFNEEPLLSWTISSPSGDVVVCPGERIHINYSGAIRWRGAQSDVSQNVDGVHINTGYIVNEASLSQEEEGVEIERLVVTERLWRFPSNSGLRELMALIQRRMPGTKMGKEGAPYMSQYVVSISATSAPCDGGRKASVTFSPAFTVPPRISAVEPLQSGVTATATVTATTLTVCASGPGSVKVTIVPGSTS